MTTFSVTIEDASHLAGITAAREARNASLPQTVKDGENDVPNPELIATDEAYVQFVMRSAAESYAKQYNTL